MRTAHLLATAAVMLLAPLAAQAQTAPSPAPAAPAAPAAPTGKVYNTTDYDLGTLLDNADTKAVLEKYIAAMVNNDQIGMARGMTLRSLQQYAGDTLTDELLAKIDADLAHIPVKE